MPTVRDPDDWQSGWIAHPLVRSGPRWTMRGPSIRGEARPAGGSHRDRDTWIQAAARQNSWVPGPGSYRSEREFTHPDQRADEVDTNITIQEEAPQYTFAREVNETCAPLRDVKTRRNSHVHPKTETHFNPGPGTYMAHSTFGCPSGAHRISYFGGRQSLSFKTVSSNR